MRPFNFRANLFVVFLLSACSGVTGDGTLSLKARLPDDVRLVTPASEYKRQAVDASLAIDIIRVSVKNDSGLVSLREFAATDREGWLTSLPAGEYQVSVEGLFGGIALVRETKKGIEIVANEFTDAGEFRLAPIVPSAIVRLEFPGLLTNQAKMPFIGLKEMFTGISVNGKPVLEVDDAKRFAFQLELREGPNTLDVAEHNAEGTLGEAHRLNIVLDTIAPKAISLTGVENPGSVLLTLSSEGATEMLLSDNAEFTGAVWQPQAATASMLYAGGFASITYYAKFRDAAGNESETLSTVVLLDVSPPVVSLLQVQGAPAFVSSPSITVEIAATDDSPMEMLIAANPSFAGSSWIPYATTHPILITGGDGPIGIYAKFRDAFGNETVLSSTTTVLDTIPPTVDAGAGTLANALFLQDATVTGAVSFQWTQQSGPGTVNFTSATTIDTLISANVDGDYIIGLTATDAAGNSAYDDAVFTWDTAGPTAPGVPIMSADPASGPVLITWAESVVEGSAFRDYELWKSIDGGVNWIFVAVTTTASIVYPPSFDGTFLFRVHGHDMLDNHGPSGPSAALTIDSTPPTVPGTPGFSANPVNTSVTISWAPSTDIGGTGVMDYVLSESADFGSTWFPVAATTGTSVLWSPLEGEYLYQVKARDNAGNFTAYSGFSMPLTVDTTPPAATLTGTPADPSNTSVLNVSVGGADVVEYMYKVGPLGGTDCASGTGYSGAIAIATPINDDLSAYPDDSMVLCVVGADAAGNWQAFADATTHGWTRDVLPPTASIDTPAPGDVTSSIVVSGTATDGAGTGVTAVDVSLSRVSDGMFWDGASFSSVATVWLTATGTASWSWNFPVVGDAAYVIASRAHDAAGSIQSPPAQVAVTLDTGAPVVTSFTVAGSLSAVSTNTVSLEFAVTDLSNIQMRFSEDPLFAGASWVSYTSPSAFTFSVGDGGKTVYAEARDQAGNVAGVETVGVYLDQTLPWTDIIAPEISSFYGTPTPPASGSATDGTGSGISAVEVALRRDSDGRYWNGSAFAFVTPTWLTPAGLDAWSWSMPALADGGHTFFTRALDAAGNHENPANSVAFVVDTLPPSAPGTPVPAATPTSTAVNLSWTAASDLNGIDFYKIEISTDQFSWSYVTTTTATSYSDMPIDGAYYYRVGSYDMAGNTTLSGNSVVVTMDTTPPASPYVALAGGITMATGATVTLDLSAGNATTVDVWEDGHYEDRISIPYTTSTSFTLSAGDGPKLVVARFGDDVGFYVEASTNVTLSTPPPWFARSSGTPNDLYDIDFPVDAQTGYAVGTSGTILKSTDSGNIWLAQTSGTVNHLYALHFSTMQTGYVVGASGTILKTTNGGSTWSALTSGTANALWGVHFPTDAITGFAVGNAGTILKTTDGGVSWAAQTSGTAQHLRAVQFPVDTSTGYTVGTSGTLLKTVDGGATWSALTSGTTDLLQGLHFPVDGVTGFTVGANGTMRKTTDAGASWTVLPSGTAQGLWSVQFPAGDQIGYAVGSSGTVLKTTDGGARWMELTSGTTAVLESVFFPVDTQTGFAVGLGGVILKTIAGGGTPPAPQLQALSIPLGSYGDAVTISGQYFGSTQGSSSVQLDAATLVVVSWSSTQIEVLVPNDIGDGVHAITVAVDGATSNGASFTVNPELTSLSVSFGFGADLISLYGSNFGASQGLGYVDLYGARYSIESWSNTQIDFRLPSDTEAGSWGISVTTDLVAATSFLPFSLYPKIDLVSPAIGVVGDAITITGTNLGFNYSLRNLIVGGFSVVEDAWYPTIVTFTVPAGTTPGGNDVSIDINSINTGISSFSVLPNITNVAAATGTGGDSISITGTSFGVSGSITLGGTLIVQDTWNDTLIDLTLPNNIEPGMHSFVVSAGGETSNASSFTVTPNLISLSAATAPAGTSVTLSGTNFGVSQGLGSVTIGGENAFVSGWSNTSISVYIPSISAGVKNVVVSAGAPLQPSNVKTLDVTNVIEVVFTNPPSNSYIAGDCQQVFYHLSDGNIQAPTTTGTSIMYSHSGTFVETFSEPSCTSATTGTWIDIGFSSGNFYFRGITAGSTTLQLTASAAGVGPDSQTEPIAPRLPTELAFSSLPATVATSQCLPVTVLTQDEYSNTSMVVSAQTIELADDGAGVFYSDSGCSISISNIVINGGNSQVIVYYANSTDEIATLTASISTFVPAAHMLQVGTPPPTITSISPSAGLPNTLVTLNGVSFGASETAPDRVYFAGVSAAVSTWSDEVITVVAPPDAAPGAISVAVLAGGIHSNKVAFEHYRPWLDQRSPVEGTTSTVLALAGRYLGATQGTVLVDGVAATVQSWFPTAVTIEVPGGINKGVVTVHVETNAALEANDVPYSQRGSDIWLPFDREVPEARARHTAVWTGTEMIIWGGRAGRSLNSGGRYNPATDSWATISQAPILGRYGHSALWTGKEMLVWGGLDYTSVQTGTGAKYNPATDSWTNILNAPLSLERHAAVWAGDIMLVAGGFDGTSEVASSLQYNPTLDSWTTLGSMVEARSDHRMVWTGKYAYVLGGTTAGTPLNTVEKLNVAAGTWSGTSSFITGRSKFIAAYNGKDTIYIHGGESAGPSYRSDLQSATVNADGTLGTWTSHASTVNAISEHTGVWTGTDLLVFGGKNASALFTAGERFNPGTGLWSNMTTINQPSLRYASSAVWTGKEMIVWGGFCELNACMVNTGARYDPQANTWTPTTAVANPMKGREQMSVVWTGTQGIIWGGSFVDSVGTQYLNSGGKYTPATDTWTPTSTVTVPSGRYAHAAVWTGTYMMILGGSDALALNTGGRYDPSADTWTATPSGGGGPTAGPTARYHATAVWDATNARVLFHGGYDGVSFMDTGKKYDPTLNAWSVMAASGVLRAQHTAVWTGTEMVVFGGTNGVPIGTGGRYNPTGDSWVALNTGPSARTFHTAVWTGSDMIVYGGWDGTAALGDGAVWNAATQTWTTTLTGSPLAARRYHTAVWTGSQMLIHGGFAASTSIGFADGAAYTYPGNTWTMMSTNRYTPFGRGIHTAFWTGEEMVVFGGGHGAHLASGGRYRP